MTSLQRRRSSRKSSGPGQLHSSGNCPSLLATQPQEKQSTRLYARCGQMVWSSCCLNQSHKLSYLPLKTKFWTSVTTTLSFDLFGARQRTLLFIRVRFQGRLLPHRRGPLADDSTLAAMFSSLANLNTEARRIKTPAVPSTNAVLATKELFGFFFNITKSHPKHTACHPTIEKLIRHDLITDSTTSPFVDAVARVLDPLLSMGTDNTAQVGSEEPTRGKGLPVLGAIGAFRNLTSLDAHAKCSWPGIYAIVCGSSPDRICSVKAAREIQSKFSPKYIGMHRCSSGIARRRLASMRGRAG